MKENDRSLQSMGYSLANQMASLSVNPPSFSVTSTPFQQVNTFVPPPSFSNLSERSQRPPSSLPGFHLPPIGRMISNQPSLGAQSMAHIGPPTAQFNAHSISAVPQGAQFMAHTQKPFSQDQLPGYGRSQNELPFKSSQHMNSVMSPPSFSKFPDRNLGPPPIVPGSQMPLTGGMYSGQPSPGLQPMIQTGPSTAQSIAHSINTVYQGPSFTAQPQNHFIQEQFPRYMRPRNDLPLISPQHINSVISPPPLSSFPERSQGPPSFTPGSQMPPIRAMFSGHPSPGIPPMAQMGPPTAQSNMQSFNGVLRGSMLPTQPQHRISPDQLPDYVQTRNELASKFGDVYETGVSGVPPSSTLDISYKDTGNVSPRFIRSTLYSIPSSNDMIKQSQLPLAFIITPLAEPIPSEQPVPLTHFEGTLPVRCNRCKAYMSPHVRFTDGGNRFQCPLCETHTQVPPEYFAHIDYAGRRVDSHLKPELFSSSYDIVATVEYCEKGVLPKPAKYIFVIDVTYASVKSGLTQLMFEKLRSEILEFLPKDPYCEADQPSPVEIGLITFDSRLHFYNFKSLDNSEVFIVPDVSDSFLPILDGFFIKASDLNEKFDEYLQHVSTMFSQTHETVVALGPAIHAACNAFQAAESPGKIFVFLTTMPTEANIPGKLVAKDEQAFLGTDKEKNALAPAIKYYTELGGRCVSAGCGVDLFLFANQFIDVPSLSEISKVSGGQVFYYRYFNVQHDADRFLADLRYTVSRPTVFNAVMRVRSSNGIRATDFIGSFTMHNVTDMEFGALDCDNAVCVEFSYDDKIRDGAPVHFQIAVLYTTIAGRRMVRVHNCNYPSTSDFLEIYQVANFEAIVAYIIKVAARSLLISSISQIRSSVITQLATILSCYRCHSPNAANSSLLLLPEALKIIPLFVNSLLKCHAIGGVQSVTPDQKSWLLSRVASMGCEQIMIVLYPSMHVLNIVECHEDREAKCIKAQFDTVRCTYEVMDPSKIYFLENSLMMWMWIGNSVPTSVINLLFGVPSINDVKTVELYELPSLNNVLSENVRDFIARTRILRKHLMRVNVVKQGHSLETFFRNELVEDSGLGASKSYASFLFELHGEIRQLASQ